MNQDHHSIPIDVDIRSISSLVKELGPSSELFIDAGRYLWAEWGDDFQRFYNIPDAEKLSSFILREYGSTVFTADEKKDLHIRTIVEYLLASKAEFESAFPVAFIARHKVSGKFIAIASIDMSDMKLMIELGHCWLANVYVVPHYRSFGIGRAICKHAIDFARQVIKSKRNSNSLYLWTFNSHLSNWYSKHFGFQHVCVIPKHGNHVNIQVLEVHL